jgi:hypothetical protein
VALFVDSGDSRGGGLECQPEPVRPPRRGGGAACRLRACAPEQRGPPPWLLPAAGLPPAAGAAAAGGPGAPGAPSGQLQQGHVAADEPAPGLLPPQHCTRAVGRHAQVGGAACLPAFLRLRPLQPVRFWVVTWALGALLLALPARHAACPAASHTHARTLTRPLCRSQTLTMRQIMNNLVVKAFSEYDQAAAALMSARIRAAAVADWQSGSPGGQWAVGSGRWAVGSGRWAVGGGPWAVGGGRWAVGGGQWAVGSGQWAVGGGPWAVGGEQWAVGSGRWAVGGGRWAVGRGRWAVGRGRRAVGGGRWAVGRGRWAVGCGRRAVGSGRWAVGGGQWAVGRPGQARTHQRAGAKAAPLPSLAVAGRGRAPPPRAAPAARSALTRPPCPPLPPPPCS